MHRLLTMPESPIAYEVVRRLNETGITASLTTENTIAGMYMGSSLNAIIWIEDPADHVRAKEMYREQLAAQRSDACPECGYSLKGHQGDVECPECGHVANAAAVDVKCPTCEEEVPSNFEVCWSCGSSINAKEIGE